MSTKDDFNGKESHKRKWGSRLLWNSLISFWIYFISIVLVSIFDKQYDTEGNLLPAQELISPYVKEMWIWLTASGLAATVATVLEFLQTYYKKTNR